MLPDVIPILLRRRMTRTSPPCRSDASSTEASLCAHASTPARARTPSLPTICSAWAPRKIFSEFLVLVEPWAEHDVLNDKHHGGGGGSRSRDEVTYTHSPCLPMGHGTLACLPWPRRGYHEHSGHRTTVVRGKNVSSARFGSWPLLLLPFAPHSNKIQLLQAKGDGRRQGNLI